MIITACVFDPQVIASAFWRGTTRSCAPAINSIGAEQACRESRASCIITAEVEANSNEKQVGENPVNDSIEP